MKKKIRDLTVVELRDFCINHSCFNSYAKDEEMVCPLLDTAKNESYPDCVIREISCNDDILEEFLNKEVEISDESND